MSDARRVMADAMSEDDLLTGVLDYARNRGWLVHHIRNSKAGVTQGHPGFPDLVLARGGRVLFVELKSERGKIRPGQVDWHRELGHVHLWTPTDWLEGHVGRMLA